VQISVASLEPVDVFRAPLEHCGFVWRPENPELTKRYFRERPGAPRTHIHVRRAGSFSEQFALFCFATTSACTRTSQVSTAH
jgi:hypothetical protein